MGDTSPVSLIILVLEVGGVDDDNLPDNFPSSPAESDAPRELSQANSKHSPIRRTIALGRMEAWTKVPSCRRPVGLPCLWPQFKGSGPKYFKSLEKCGLPKCMISLRLSMFVSNLTGDAVAQLPKEHQ